VIVGIDSVSIGLFSRRAGELQGRNAAAGSALRSGGDDPQRNCFIPTISAVWSVMIDAEHGVKKDGTPMFQGAAFWTDGGHDTNSPALQTADQQSKSR